MPTSLINGKAWTARVFNSIVYYTGVKRVLDIGPGMGTYTYLRGDDQHWVCIEAWGDYVNKYSLEEKYDKVIVADVRYINFAKIGKFDVCLLGDVLEHMSKDDAIEVIENVLMSCRVAIVSMPIVNFPQGAVDGNFFERHVKDDWSHTEIMDTFPHIYLSFIDHPIGVYCMAARGGDIRLLKQLASALDAGGAG